MEAIQVMQNMKSIPSHVLMGMTQFEYNFRSTVYDKRIPTDLDALFLEEDERGEE